MVPQTCDVNPSFGSNARVVMVATVIGRDTGTSVLKNVLNAFQGFHMHSYAAGSGWVHLSEFAQRWMVMREKMTDPSNSEFIHFSQFVARANDGFEPSADTDFRTMKELVRRTVKPAWMQLFNLTKVLCGLRKLVIEAYNPRGHAAFGFVHAFHHNGESDSGAPSAHRSYSSAQALRSLDLFLQLFPRGLIILHLPVAEIPGLKQHSPRCVCSGPTPYCRPASAQAVSLRWPDARLDMMRQLAKYHCFRPGRSLLVAANEDFRNTSRMTRRLARFLGEPYSPHLRREAIKAIGWWASKLRRDELFDIPVISHDGGPSEQRRMSPQIPARTLARQFRECSKESSAEATRDAVFLCPSFRCEVEPPFPATKSNEIKAKGHCSTCPATLADWAWSSSRSTIEMHRTIRGGAGKQQAPCGTQ